MKASKIEAVIFDLGGVLVDWNPEYLYTKIFKNDTKKMIQHIAFKRNDGC